MMKRKMSEESNSVSVKKRLHAAEAELRSVRLDRQQDNDGYISSISVLTQKYKDIQKNLDKAEDEIVKVLTVSAEELETAQKELGEMKEELEDVKGDLCMLKEELEETKEDLYETRDMLAASQMAFDEERDEMFKWKREAEKMTKAYSELKKLWTRAVTQSRLLQYALSAENDGLEDDTEVESTTQA